MQGYESTKETEMLTPELKAQAPKCPEKFESLTDLYVFICKGLEWWESVLKVTGDHETRFFIKYQIALCEKSKADIRQMIIEKFTESKEGK
jgi:hypothetical protein